MSSPPAPGVRAVPQQPARLQQGMWLEPMRASHAAAISAIQRACYPARLLESVDHILARAAVFPAGSVVALAPASGAAAPVVVGYAQAYPYGSSAAPPALNDSDAPAAIAAALAAPGDALLFVHEVTVYRQGQGLGRALLANVCAAGFAAGLRTAMLVAVLGRAPLWTHLGFTHVRDLPGYGADDDGGGGGADGGGGGAADGGAAAAPFELPQLPSASNPDTSAVVMTAVLRG